MKFTKNKTSALLGCLLAATSLSALAKGGLFYEHQSFGYNPSAGSSLSFGVHSVGIYDTTGVLSASLAGAVNQELSREKARDKKIKDIELHGEAVEGTTYTYSWKEPKPVANDGEIYRFFWSGEGHASEQFKKISTDPSPSLWGLEYHSTLWTKESTPVSYSFGWGLINYHFRTDLVNPAPSGGTAVITDYVTTSFPLDFSVTFHPIDSVATYADLGVGPINYIRKQPKYHHFEAGAVWTLTDSVRVNASYKFVSDSLSDSAGSKSGYRFAYKASIFSLGAGWYF